MRRIFPSFAIITSLVSACYFPNSTTSPGITQTDQQFITPNITIQLKLNLPKPLEKEDRVGVEIFDEVAGLPFNKQTYELSPVEELAYAVDLVFPAGSVVKYRYIKMGEETIPEQTFAGKPVRYRMLCASEPKVIHDVMKTWGKELVMEETGILQGTVILEETLQPVSDILISAGGQLTTTDANGHFLINGLPKGEHNVLFYAIDGRYKPFQQGAVIAAGSITPVTVALKPAKPVTVRFNVTPPKDALGAPIYLAGNLLQLGNTFSDLVGGTSIKPSLMPNLTPQADGTLFIDLPLYAGLDLRYKFTIGDGYWNAERNPSGELFTRQLIVPDRDAVIDLVIETWRVDGFSPITFEINIPQETAPRDEKFIQFKQDSWMEPIPLWPLGGGDFLYILYSPFFEKTNLSYRFCRNADCTHALNVLGSTSDFQVEPSDKEQLRTHTIENWENFDYEQIITGMNQIPLPPRSNSYNRIIELTPAMNATWSIYALPELANLADLGVDTVIFTPAWSYQHDAKLLKPTLGKTPFSHQMIELLMHAESLGLSPALYPQIKPDNQTGTYWPPQKGTGSDWSTWFESYRIMLLNYATIAQNAEAEMLIIGGDPVLPTFTGGVYPDDPESDVPESSIAFWRDLIVNIRKVYKGKLVWATNAHQSVAPLPEFVEMFDAIYINIDSPLVIGQSATLDDIAGAFTTLVDNHLYEVYRSTAKPIILALAYPSVDRAFQGCLMIQENCINDGLFLADEMAGFSVNPDMQVLIYEAILPIIASRTWVTGTSIRGYQPSVTLQDGSSSIRGKPAANIVFNWFMAMKP